MDRREMLKLSGASSLATLLPMAYGATPADGPVGPVPQWEVVELTLPGPASGNPFVDVRLSASFSTGSRSVAVDGFYDGNGTYKIRFMPDAQGDWRYATSSNVPELTGKTGAFTCAGPLAGVHGPVRVRNTQHFAYADGTPYFPFGTTSYAWVHQPEALQQETLRTLAAAPFNKIRMLIFPKSYVYNHNEPPLYPFVRDASGKSDFTRPNPAFFAHIEQRVADLRRLNIEADLILFHPYDRWGYSTMAAADDDRYLRYVLARMSAYRNIWWSLANEWDLMRAKSREDFDRFFQIVQAQDPVGHLRSVHYGRTMYDYSRPWVTHASLQTHAFDNAPGWLQAWLKPLVFDEVQYEGNIPLSWGNVSGQEEARRVWLGVMAGCYVTHGETILPADYPMGPNAPQPVLWWAHGGTLHGDSPARIGFLRKLVEETATAAGADSRRTGLTAPRQAFQISASTVEADGRTTQDVFYYTDDHQPLFGTYRLPEGTYRADLIDPWAMQIRPLPGTFSGTQGPVPTARPGALGGGTEIKLPGRPFQAVRFRRI